MFDQKKRELEFYLTSNCNVVFTEVKNLEQHYTVITIDNAEDLSVIAYEIWSTDTLLINNRSRNIYQRNLIDFYNIVKSYNEKTNNVKDHFKPSCVFKHKDSQNNNKLYFVTIEGFELIETVNTDSVSNETGLIVDGSNTSSLKMYCKNNFVDMDGDDPFTTNERIPNGNYENVNFNISGFPFNDLDIESKFNPKIKNRYTSLLNKEKNILTFHPDAHTETSTPGYNYILESECIINNEDRNFLYITLPDASDMITEYQDWNQAASRVSNQEFRNKRDISISEFVTRVNDFNSFLTIKPGKLSRMPIPLKLKNLWFKPTVYFEIQGNKYLGVISDFEMELDNNNEYFLNITIEKSKMRINEKAAFDYSNIKSTPYTRDDNILVTSEKIFMNIDDLPEANSFDPEVRNNMLYVYGIAILARNFDTRDALSRMGLLKNINEKIENEAFVSDIIEIPKNIPPIISNANNSVVNIDPSDLIYNNFVFTGNTALSTMRSEFAKGFVGSYPAHLFRISTQINNYVAQLINIAVHPDPTHDTIITIHNTTLGRKETYTDSTPSIELTGYAVYHIEIYKKLKDSNIKYQKGKSAKDFREANSGEYTMTIQGRPADHVRSFMPKPEMGIEQITIDRPAAGTPSGQNFYGDDIILNNRGGYIKGTTGNPTYIKEIILTESTNINIQYSEIFDDAVITIVPITEDRNGFRDENSWFRFTGQIGVINFQLAGPTSQSKYANKRYQIEFSSTSAMPSPLDNPDFFQKFSYIINVGGVSIGPGQPFNLLARRSSNLQPKSIKNIESKNDNSKLLKRFKKRNNNGTRTKPIMREKIITVLSENNNVGEPTITFQETGRVATNFLSLNRGSFYKFDISRLPPNKFFQIRSDPLDSASALHDNIVGDSGTVDSYISFIPQMELSFDKAYFVENFLPGISEGAEINYGTLNFPFQSIQADQIFNYKLKVINNQLAIYNSVTSNVIDGRLNVYQGYEYRFDTSDGSLFGRTVVFSSENRIHTTATIDRNGSAGNPNSYINITFEVTNDFRVGGGEDYRIQLTGSGGEEINSVVIHTMDPYTSSEDGMTPLVYLSFLAVVALIAAAVRARRVTETSQGRISEGENASHAAIEGDAANDTVQAVTGQKTGRLDVPGAGAKVVNPSFDNQALNDADGGAFDEHGEVQAKRFENSKTLAKATQQSLQLAGGGGGGDTGSDDAEALVKTIEELAGQTVKVFNDLGELIQYVDSAEGPTAAEMEGVLIDELPPIIQQGNPDSLILRITQKFEGGSSTGNLLTSGETRSNGDPHLKLTIEPRKDIPITATRVPGIRLAFKNAEGDLVQQLFVKGTHLYNVSEGETIQTKVQDQGLIGNTRGGTFEGYCLTVPVSDAGGFGMSGLRQLPNGEYILIADNHTAISRNGREGGRNNFRVDQPTTESQLRGPAEGQQTLHDDGVEMTDGAVEQTIYADIATLEARMVGFLQEGGMLPPEASAEAQEYFQNLRDQPSGGGVADSAQASGMADAVEVIYTTLEHAAESAGIQAARVEALEGTTVFFTPKEVELLLSETTGDDLIDRIIDDLVKRLEPLTLRMEAAPATDADAGTWRPVLKGALRLNFANDVKAQLIAQQDSGISSSDVDFYTSKLFDGINLADFLEIDGVGLVESFLNGDGPPELQDWRFTSLADGGMGHTRFGEFTVGFGGDIPPSMSTSQDVLNAARVKSDGTIKGIDLRDGNIAERWVIEYQINKIIVSNGFGEFNGGTGIENINPSNFSYKGDTPAAVKSKFDALKVDLYNSSVNNVEVARTGGARWKFLTKDADYIRTVPAEQLMEASPLSKAELDSFQSDTGDLIPLSEENFTLSDIITRNANDVMLNGVRLRRGLDKVLASVGRYRVGDGSMDEIAENSELEEIFDKLVNSLTTSSGDENKTITDDFDLDPELGRPLTADEREVIQRNKERLNDLVKRAQEKAISDLTMDKLGHNMRYGVARTGSTPENAASELYAKSMTISFYKELVNLRKEDFTTQNAAGTELGLPETLTPRDLLFVLRPAKLQQLDALVKVQFYLGDDGLNMVLNRSDPLTLTPEEIADILGPNARVDFDGNNFTPQDREALKQFTQERVNQENNITNQTKGTNVFTKLDAAVVRLADKAREEFGFELTQKGWEILTDATNPEAQKQLENLQKEFMEGLHYNEFGANQKILDALYESASKSILNLEPAQIRDIESTVNEQDYSTNDDYDAEIRRRLTLEVKEGMKVEFPKSIAATPPAQAGSFLSEEYRLKLSEDGKLLFEAVETRIDPFLDAILDFKPI